MSCKYLDKQCHEQQAATLNICGQLNNKGGGVALTPNTSFRIFTPFNVHTLLFVIQHMEGRGGNEFHYGFQGGISSFLKGLF